MHDIITKSFGGLSTQQYLRHLFFGIVVLALFCFPALGSDKPIPTQFLIFSVICTFLYPYSRFVYERIIGFIIGNNQVFGSIFIVVVVKAFTITACWMFAIFIAPVGLLWLYFDNRNRITAPTSEIND